MCSFYFVIGKFMWILLILDWIGMDAGEEIHFTFTTFTRYYAAILNCISTLAGARAHAVTPKLKIYNFVFILLWCHPPSTAMTNKTAPKRIKSISIDRIRNLILTQHPEGNEMKLVQIRNADCCFNSFVGILISKYLSSDLAWNWGIYLTRIALPFSHLTLPLTGFCFFFFCSRLTSNSQALGVVFFVEVIVSVINNGKEVP